METPNNFEEQEKIIDGLISNLETQEEMNPGDVISDLITFAPYEGNDAANPDYIEEVAEMLGISPAELTAYAIKKVEENWNDSKE